MKTVSELCIEAHDGSKAKGFWNHDTSCAWAVAGQPGREPQPPEKAMREGITVSANDQIIGRVAACCCVNRDLSMKRNLLHSEISEALEEFRLGDEKRGGKIGDILFEKQDGSRSINDVAPDAPASDGPRPRKPVGFIVELADAAIRLFDLCGFLDVRLVRVDATRLRNDPELAALGWGELIEALHDGVTGLQLGPREGTFNELLTMLEFAALRAGGDLWTAIEIKMRYNATREFMHGKTC